MRLAINHIVDSELESRALQVRNRLDGQDNPEGIARIFNRAQGDIEVDDYYNNEHRNEAMQVLIKEVGNYDGAQETQALLEIVEPFFDRGRRRVVENIRSVGNILGKKDALKLIELMQTQEMVEEVARSREQPAIDDVRRKPSIIADTILEKFRENNVEPGNENEPNALTVAIVENANPASETNSVSETNSQQQEAPSPRASSVYCLAILQKFMGKRK
jgi:hypothetical protein